MRTAIIIGLGLLSLCAVMAGAAVSLYRYATKPVGGSEALAVVWIKPGQSFSETVAQLQEVGLVTAPNRFRWLAALTGDDRRVQAGEYRLSTSMTPRAMLNTLVRGRILLHKVLIPEGSNLFRISEILEEAGLVSRDAFLEKASDRVLMQALGVEGPTFEGYLFPETYQFPRGVTAEEVIRTMVAHFFSVFLPSWADRAHAMGFTVHQIVTLASIVEKETGKPDERALIAAVFMNRLKRGMRLESDPTVIYGIKNFDGNLTRKDLETPTPYNTYQISALPPGPIGNPGRAAIEAVLYPSGESYLYFVSKNDGSHQFSRTLAEHKRMVRRYQPRR
jgi:UPF0755 protein